MPAPWRHPPRLSSPEAGACTQSCEQQSLKKCEFFEHTVFDFIEEKSRKLLWKEPARLDDLCNVKVFYVAAQPLELQVSHAPAGRGRVRTDGRVNGAGTGRVELGRARGCDPDGQTKTGKLRLPGCVADEFQAPGGRKGEPACRCRQSPVCAAPNPSLPATAHTMHKAIMSTRQQLSAQSLEFLSQACQAHLSALCLKPRTSITTSLRATLQAASISLHQHSKSNAPAAKPSRTTSATASGRVEAAPQRQQAVRRSQRQARRAWQQTAHGTVSPSARHSSHPAWQAGAERRTARVQACMSVNATRSSPAHSIPHTHLRYPLPAPYSMYVTSPASCSRPRACGSSEGAPARRRVTAGRRPASCTLRSPSARPLKRSRRAEQQGPPGS